MKLHVAERLPLFSKQFPRFFYACAWPRLAAVSEKGPVVVSVDAGQWTMYDGGVTWRSIRALNDDSDLC